MRAPVSTRNAPVSDNTPSPRDSAISISSEEDKPVKISGVERAASLMLVSVLSTVLLANKRFFYFRCVFGIFFN